jgi:prolyl-tRNA editing enzyme YbaK/EbsC (Cys-tRNA(Pro) deacylase)
MVARVAAWPDNVQRVADFLLTAGAEARIEEFPVGTATAADAAAAVGCEPADIVKSLVVACDDRFVLALIPGDRRADLDKIARAAGARSARIAQAREVELLTGFPPGGVAPFPLPPVDRVLMERLLLVRGTLWTGAGTTRHVAAVPAGELLRLTRAIPADLVAEA